MALPEHIATIGAEQLADPRPARPGETCHRCHEPAVAALDVAMTVNGTPIGVLSLATCGEHPTNEED